MSPEKIAVFGGGTWGSTLAHVLAGQGNDVSVWEFNPQIAEQLKKTRRLSTLPQLVLDDRVKVSNNMNEVTAGAGILLSVTPSHTVRATFSTARKNKALPTGALVISASKGFDPGTNASMSQVIESEFPERGDIVILAGPSHAEEVALKKPVALVSASASAEAAQRVQKLFNMENVRVYTGDDPVGVELGGSLKNIFAVACGVCDGLDLGDNTKAAIMTRGLMEMTRLGTSLGAQTLTFFGLSGLGDLIVTCNSKHSRNRLLGEKIGRGKSSEEALKEMTMVAEGFNTTNSAFHLAKLRGIDVPIINELYFMLFEGKAPRESMRDLLGRQARHEMEGIRL